MTTCSSYWPKLPPIWGLWLDWTLTGDNGKAISTIGWKPAVTPPPKFYMKKNFCSWLKTKGAFTLQFYPHSVVMDNILVATLNDYGHTLENPFMVDCGKRVGGGRTFTHSLLTFYWILHIYILYVFYSDFPIRKLFEEQAQCQAITK